MCIRDSLIITRTATHVVLLQAMTAPGYAARWFRSWKRSFLAQASGLADRARQHKERSRLRQEAADDRVRCDSAIKIQRHRAFWASGPLLHACYAAPIFSELSHKCLRRAPHTPPQSYPLRKYADSTPIEHPFLRVYKINGNTTMVDVGRFIG